MVNVKRHTRRTKKGTTRVKAHSRNTHKMLMITSPLYFKNMLVENKKAGIRLAKSLGENPKNLEFKEWLLKKESPNYIQDESQLVNNPSFRITGKLTGTDTKQNIVSYNDRYVSRKLYVDEAGKKYVKHGGKWWKFPEQVEY